MILEGTEKVQQYPTKVSSNPMLSVCVQTYKHEEFIAKCLDGILMQETNFDIEILIGEDNSPDNTRAICQSYADKYPDKLKLFLHDRSNVIYINERPTGRFNFIYNLQQAKGKYLALCEGDDYWTDQYKLQKQVDFLEANPDFAICSHDIKVVDENNKITRQEISGHSGTYTDQDLAKGNFLPTVSVIFRNYFLKNGIPNYFLNVYLGDWALHLFNAQFGKVYFIPEIMAAYRVHNTGMWMGENSENRLKIFNYTLNELKKVYEKKYQVAFKEAKRFMELSHVSGQLGSGVFKLSMLGDIWGFLVFKSKFRYSLRDIIWLYKNGIFSSPK